MESSLGFSTIFFLTVLTKQFPRKSKYLYGVMEGWGKCEQIFLTRYRLLPGLQVAGMGEPTWRLVEAVLTGQDCRALMYFVHSVPVKGWSPGRKGAVCSTLLPSSLQLPAERHLSQHFAPGVVTGGNQSRDEQRIENETVPGQIRK